MATTTAGDLVPTDRSLEVGALRGVVAYRWLTLFWASLALVFSRDHLSRPGAALLGLGAAAAFTLATTLGARGRARALMRPVTMWVETSIGTALLLLDGVVWGGVEGETRRQSLPWAWPHGAILATAAVFGMKPGLAVATVLAVASYWGELEVRGGTESWVGVGSKSALYFLAAIGTALVMDRLRDAATQISAARAREEMAATLHDGVLQTLAVIQRRSDDTELVELARRQDRELRSYLWGTDVPGDLADTVATAALRARDGYGVDVSLFVPDDLPTLDDRVRRALAGAVGEAITNAAKHAGASRVTVFAEPIDDHPDDHTVYFSVHDDGRGFDPEADEGAGIRRSIRARVAEIGGRVEITSSPTNGAEVQFWVGGRSPSDG